MNCQEKNVLKGPVVLWGQLHQHPEVGTTRRVIKANQQLHLHRHLAPHPRPQGWHLTLMPGLLLLAAPPAPTPWHLPLVGLLHLFPPLQVAAPAPLIAFPNCLRCTHGQYEGQQQGPETVQAPDLKTNTECAPLLQFIYACSMPTMGPAGLQATIAYILVDMCGYFKVVGWGDNFGCCSGGQRLR